VWEKSSAGRRLSGNFDRSFELLYDFRVQDASGMKGDDHPDIILEIDPVATLAADKPETGFD
jgi:hypothetical protein